MDTRSVAIVLFYSSDGKVLLQERKKKRHFDENCGFFGGGMEEGETPEQTIKREIREELGIELKKFKFLKHYHQIFENYNVIINKNAFIAKMPDMNKIKCMEGKPIVVSWEDALKLKMIPGDDVVLREMYNFIKDNSLIKK